MRHGNVDILWKYTFDFAKLQNKRSARYSDTESHQIESVKAGPDVGYILQKAPGQIPSNVHHQEKGPTDHKWNIVDASEVPTSKESTKQN